MKVDYCYKASVSIYKRNGLLPLMALFVLMLMGFGATYGNWGVAIAAVVGFTVFIGIMLYFTEDLEYLLFTTQHVIHFRRGVQVARYEFNNVLGFKIFQGNKSGNGCCLYIKGRKPFYFFELDKPGGLDVIPVDFYKFLFERNPEIQITEKSGFYHFKYFLFHGEVRKVEM